MSSDTIPADDVMNVGQELVRWAAKKGLDPNTMFFACLFTAWVYVLADGKTVDAKAVIDQSVELLGRLIDGRLHRVAAGEAN